MVLTMRLVIPATAPVGSTLWGGISHRRSPHDSPMPIPMRYRRAFCRVRESWARSARCDDIARPFPCTATRGDGAHEASALAPYHIRPGGPGGRDVRHTTVTRLCLARRLYLLSASLTIPLICCQINGFRRVSSCGAAMARRRKEERRAGTTARENLKQLGRFSSRVGSPGCPCLRCGA